MTNVPHCFLQVIFQFCQLLSVFMMDSEWPSLTRVLVAGGIMIVSLVVVKLLSLKFDCSEDQSK
jgi:hypothetical protein